MLGNILISGLFFSIDIFLLALAGTLRLFPSFLKSGRVMLRKFMGLSFKFYQLILGQTAPFLQNRWGFNILVGLLRIISTIVLSLILGLLILLLLGLPISIWTIGLCFIHGLTVGLVWGEMEPPIAEGFRMGENIE